MVGVWVSVLGPTRVRSADGAIDVSRASRRRLLTILAAVDGKALTTEVLIDRFWRGRPPPSAKGALHTHVSGLRAQLPADAVVTDVDGYRLDLDVVDIDVRRLASYADEIQSARREGDWATAASCAAAVWQLPDGVPFAELDDDFVEPARAAVDTQRSLVDEIGVEALIELGEFDRALPVAERLTIEHPLRERGWELLALARRSLGRQGEALRALHAGRAALAEAGLEPGSGLREAERLVLATDPSDEADPSRVPAPFSAFVGRHEELTSVSGYLRERRLVSVTGVGGVGKSRFSIELARREAETGWFERQWFVELADERDPERIADRVATTLGRSVVGAGSPTEAVTDAIGGRRAVLVLDNCEHLLDGAARFVRSALERCPRLHIVATSRTPLGLPDEYVVDLPPLSARAGIGDDAESEAVTLFVTRASAAQPDIVLRGPDLRLISTICERAGGLPLAIEILAARSRDVGLADLAAAAERSFASTTAPPGSVDARHESMQRVIDWSLSLLDEATVDLARDLSVFRGWFDVVSVAAVCDVTADEAVALLERLVEAALVRPRTATDDRDMPATSFSLLEVVRQALGATLPTDRATALRARHRDHVAARCSELRLFWMQPPERRAQPTFNPWWDELPFSIENARAAAETQPRPGVDVLGVLAHEAAATGHHARAVRTLESMLIAADDDDRELHAICRSFLASEILLAGSPARAKVHMAIAAEIAETLPTSFAKALVLSRASIITMSLPEVGSAEGVTPALAALEVAKQLGPFARWRVEALVATVLARARRFDDAHRHLDVLVDGTKDADDPALRSLVITAALNVHVLSGSNRAVIAPWIDAALVFIADHPSAAQSDLGSWTIWVLGQAGRIGEARHILDRHAPVEGYEDSSYRAIRARIDWLSGDPAGAAESAENALQNLTDPYWYPNLRTTAAESRAELRDLAAVRHHVEHVESDPLVSGDHQLIPVLRPLVHAEVDAALGADGRQRERHERAAREAVARMRSAVAALPHDDVPIWLETPEVYIALAEAELSRLGTTDEQVRAWSELVDVPRTLHYAAAVDRRLSELRAAR